VSFKFSGRVPSFAIGAFFAFYALLSLMTAAVFLNQVGPHPFALVYLTYAALNGTMAYGMCRDRRWVMPIFALNVALAVERAVSFGGLSVATGAAIAISTAALAISLSRQDQQRGELLAAAPLLLFALQQLLPYLVQPPVVQ
jgi:hypothetical protein